MAFFTRMVVAASSKNELPPGEVAQPARPSSAAAMASAKRCLSLIISLSLVRAQHARNTALRHVLPRKNCTPGARPPIRSRWPSRPRNAKLPRQQLRELRALHQADALLRREFPCPLGDLPGRDVDALVRLARTTRRLQLAQRLDPRARRLPALAGDERAARALNQLEIRVCGEPAHRVALAAVGLLDHGREILPGHGSQALERGRDAPGARR